MIAGSIEFLHHLLTKLPSTSASLEERRGDGFSVGLFVEVLAAEAITRSMISCVETLLKLGGSFISGGLGGDQAPLSPDPVLQLEESPLSWQNFIHSAKLFFCFCEY